ncbi:hypothetical protein [Paeniglutamicibacter sp.]|uniref:hypothetical protein n=1 Tax=Paeniglutamicibacter sp. TaxID=1934391 RepID=UPI00398A292A
MLERIGRYHEALGHDVLCLGLESPGLTETQRRDSLDVFFGELAPQLRAKHPAKIWADSAPAGAVGHGPRCADG